MISPTDESTRDIVPCTSSNRLISSRACSFLDLAIELYGENRYQSSNNLAIYSEHSLCRRLGQSGTRNRKDGKICSQDFLIARESNEPEYTDINNQISGMVKAGNTGNIGITEMEGDSQIVQTQANSLDVDDKDVKVLDLNMPKDKNAAIYLDGHFSDTSSVGNTDYVLKQRLSGSSTDDAGYFSAAAPANYVDSDDQSATSRCDVSIGIESMKESLDSLMGTDFIENNDFNDNTNVCVNRVYE